MMVASFVVDWMIVRNTWRDVDLPSTLKINWRVLSLPTNACNATESIYWGFAIGTDVELLSTSSDFLSVGREMGPGKTEQRTIAMKNNRSKNV